MVKKPVLSIGMIVKNEMRCLERCLKSLEPLRQAIPCQLVIADTGSTDGTQEIAKQYADVFFEFEWINDFAAARNAVLERCTGIWHLQLDADEWFEDCQPLIRIMQQEQLNQYEFILLIVRNLKKPGNMEQYADFNNARIFRIQDDISFVGRIHEIPRKKNMKQKSNAIVFKDIILYHDGYVDGILAQDERTKGQRNMELLREEVKTSPNSIRILCECIESCHDNPAELMGYVEQGIKCLETHTADETGFAPSLYRHAIHQYGEFGQMEQAQKVWDLGNKQFSNSLYLQLDGAGFMMMGYYKQNQYKEAAQYGLIWEKTQCKYEADKIDVAEISLGTLMLSPLQQAAELRAMLFECLCQLENWETASDVLFRMRIEHTSMHNLARIANMLFLYGHHLPKVEILLNSFWNESKQPFYLSKREDDWKRWRAMLLAKMEEAFRKDDPMWPAITTLEGDLGCSARALDCRDMEKLPAMLEEIEDWGNVLPAIFSYILEEYIPFPAGFYASKREMLTSLAEGISILPGMTQLVLEYMEELPPHSLPQLFWYHILTADLLQRGRWENVQEGRELCVAFAQLEKELLGQMYCPQMLEEQNCALLPPVHRFGIYIMDAMKAREELKNLEYVQALRKALQEAEPMQKAVDLLLDWKIVPPLTPELSALAEQIKAVLAQYSDNDPAVLALKRSPVYQQVEPLLEAQEQQEPLKAQPPEEEPDASLMQEFKNWQEQCQFDNKDQAVAAVQSAFQMNTPDIQTSLEKYWKQYSLWGHDTETVLNNIAVALYEHKRDFDWLFQRLSDNYSRQVLLAVLNNWRFFAMEGLLAVRETRYDDYFDLQLLQCGRKDVIADLGAYIGDTFVSYIKNYGVGAYKRYYCYEITTDSFEKLYQATKDYPRVVLRHKGAGEGAHTMYIEPGLENSSNTLGESGNEPVQIVALDDDIQEPLTLIKMDIEGAEQSALRGCARHIQMDRPKLALSVYHNFEDIWKLPRMIEELVPGYRFYLRYHGGQGWATELTLIALPPVAE